MPRNVDSTQTATPIRSGRGVTLADIAARIGVSKVTVSYVLNGRETHVRISDRTRERVLATAREMGYSPNAVARGLTRRRMDTLTLVMQSPNVFQGGSGFINALMHGVVEAANAANFDLMLHTRAQPDDDAEVRSLTDGRSDGCLLLRDRDDPLLAQVENRGHPCVSIFARPALADAWYVDSDNVQGGRMVAQYLISLGHRRIGFIAGSPHSSAVADRRQGFYAALAGAGIVVNPAWEVQVNYAGGDFGPLLAMMDRAPRGERPTALFAWSDDVAAQAIRMLREARGLRIPEDVSVIGYDGTEETGERGCIPRLTSIRQPISEIAGRGVALLTARIREEAVEETAVLYPPALIVRESCAAPSPHA